MKNVKSAMNTKYQRKKFKMSKHIFWISSYPKSGNTLIRSMLSAYFFSKDGNFSKEIIKNISKEKILEILTMIDRNEYKRRQSPPGIKITPLAFGRDRRYPIASDYKYTYRDY